MVIPVYKEPNRIELLSFKQCIKILANYDIAIVTNSNVNLKDYIAYAKQNEKELIVELFDAYFFKNIEGYNSLCMSKQFYRRFSQSFEYMLIYQLDAWVFSDNLQEWCDKGFDYVGSPFFINSGKETEKVIFTGVGNGGLSLRKIQYCIDVLSLPSHLPFLTPKKLLKQWRIKAIEDNCSCGKSMLLLLWYIIKASGVRNTLNFYKKYANEDYVFSDFAIGSWYISPNIPTAVLASEFSFEKNPSLLFHLIGNHLPFGCHAFEKYEYDSFWSRYISL